MVPVLGSERVPHARGAATLGAWCGRVGGPNALRDRALLRLLRGRGGSLLPLVTLLPVLPDLHALAAVLAPAAGHPVLLLLWLRSAAPSRSGGRASSARLNPRRRGDGWERGCPPRPGRRWGLPPPPSPFPRDCDPAEGRRARAGGAA